MSKAKKRPTLRNMTPYYCGIDGAPTLLPTNAVRVGLLINGGIVPASIAVTLRSNDDENGEERRCILNFVQGDNVIIALPLPRRGVTALARFFKTAGDAMQGVKGEAKKPSRIIVPGEVNP